MDIPKLQVDHIAQQAEAYASAFEMKASRGPSVWPLDLVLIVIATVSLVFALAIAQDTRSRCNCAPLESRSAACQCGDCTCDPCQCNTTKEIP